MYYEHEENYMVTGSWDYQAQADFENEQIFYVIKDFVKSYLFLNLDYICLTF